MLVYVRTDIRLTSGGLIPIMWTSLFFTFIKDLFSLVVQICYVLSISAAVVHGSFRWDQYPGFLNNRFPDSLEKFRCGSQKKCHRLDLRHPFCSHPVQTIWRWLFFVYGYCMLVASLVLELVVGYLQSQLSIWRKYRKSHICIRKEIMACTCMVRYGGNTISVVVPWQHRQFPPQYTEQLVCPGCEE